MVCYYYHFSLRKASGPFSIPTYILKLIKEIVAKPLETLFNVSFITGIVPSSLKVANVISVYKEGSQFSFCNYRPISLLSIFNKLLEKLVSKRLIKFIEKEYILFSKQFGLAKYSTDHAILSITDEIQRAIDEGYYSCGIFLDFSKAFDTVNHTILFKKLEYYGIRGITGSWFNSYLSNRQQTVTVNNITSTSTLISCGVPQGSVLGPLLFLIYINDFHLCSNLLQFHLFADDANLFYKNKNIDILEENINKELRNIHDWLCVNGLSLNIEKSNFVFFHPRQRKIKSNFRLIIHDKFLRGDHCIKYLGIYIDCHLNWKSHVMYIGKKIQRSIGILSKIRYYVDAGILNDRYYALIYSFLLYGIIAWGSTYESNLQPLFILQKKALRIMTFSNFDEHSSPLFTQLKIIKLFDITSQTVIFMMNFYNQSLPATFNTLFNLVNCVHNYNTRFAAKQSYYIPKIRTNYRLFNIRFRGPKIWNSINDDIKKCSSVREFKNKLKEEFVNNY